MNIQRELFAIAPIVPGLQLAKEVRAQWQHSIAPQNVTRRSIAFRTLR